VKILLTSGGTKLPIDRVRSITNMSRGTFGARIARQLLLLAKDEDELDLTFFCADGSRTPFMAIVDMFKDHESGYYHDAIEDVELLWKTRGHLYSQFSYKSFVDYAAFLESYVSTSRPDVVILAAAVSDYVPIDVVSGKIRSKGDLTIKLKPAPKLISCVKMWHSSCHLVGFKLLVDSTDDELVCAAKSSLVKNGCDFVVANDLRDIKAGKHRLLIVSEEGVEEHKTVADPNHLARVVATKCLELKK